VLVDEAELEAIQEAARQQQLTVAEWVRRALREARREGPMDTMRKLEAVRAAVEHHFPTADMPEMLAEIERGYLGEAR